eukprot:4552352-Prymnesium_polylepis.1
MSCSHKFTTRVSASASASSAVRRSNARPSSPASRESDPCTSRHSRPGCDGASCAQMPRVVCERPRESSSTPNDVPKAELSHVDLPLDCGPITATTE